jgi:hypothetical protein
MSGSQPRFRLVSGHRFTLPDLKPLLQRLRRYLNELDWSKLLPTEISVVIFVVFATLILMCRFQLKQEPAAHTLTMRFNTRGSKNGQTRILLLTPTMDHLFDRGFIGFEDSGIAIVSPVAHVPSLKRMGLATDRVISVGTFSQGQKQFLDYHRESVLLQARR